MSREKRTGKNAQGIIVVRIQKGNKPRRQNCLKQDAISETLGTFYVVSDFHESVRAVRTYRAFSLRGRRRP